MIGLAKVAARIKEYNFHAIIIIGGYEVTKTIHKRASIIIDENLY